VSFHLSGFGDEIHADPVVQVAVLRALGAHHIEVRGAWGLNVLELSDERLTELRETFTEMGMGVSAIASPIGKVDVELPIEHELNRLDRAITVADELGSRYIRIFSFQHDGRTPEEVSVAVLERMSALAALAEKRGVVLLHENEIGIYGDVPERVAEIVETVDSPALRVAWDSGNFVRAGLRPHDDAYSRLRPYLDYLQVKDAVAGVGSVPAGEGDGQLRETIGALVTSGFDGFASLEPHLAVAGALGGFSGPHGFGAAARAFARLVADVGGELE
jgi:sugar phosphate isomerase/epimerase